MAALNPKGIVFFVAFVPQFMAPYAPFLPQAAILVVSVTMASATALPWTALAGRVSSLKRRPPVRRGFNRTGGGVLVGAGVALARSMSAPSPCCRYTGSIIPDACIVNSRR